MDKAILTKALQLLSDNAYLTYMRISGNDLCKGEDWYLQHRDFSKEHLNAHRDASEWLGKHRAYGEVLKMLQSPPPAHTGDENA